MRDKLEAILASKAITHARSILLLLLRWRREYRYLAIAYLIFLTPIFLTNSLTLPLMLFSSLVVPVTILSWLVFRLERTKHPGSETTVRTLKLSGDIPFTFSVIFWSVFLYLLMMNLSTWSQPGTTKRLLEQQWLYSGCILIFLLVTAVLVVSCPKFLATLFLMMSTIIAASALFNVVEFILATRLTERLSDYRLRAVLGMPDYRNATNISATYAVFFITSIATMFGRQLSRRWQFLQVPVALSLLAGVLLTQARSAYVAVLVGLFVTSLATARLNWRVLAAAILVGGAALMMIPQVRQAIAARGESYRPEIWRTYAAKAAERPWLGYGALSNIDIHMKDGVTVDQPHNLILSAQIRSGVGGAFAMLVTLLASLYWAGRYFRVGRDILPLAVIATMTVAGMFDYNLLITAPTWPWVTFWLPVGICVGAEIAVTRAAVPAFKSPSQGER